MTWLPEANRCAIIIVCDDLPERVKNAEIAAHFSEMQHTMHRRGAGSAERKETDPRLLRRCGATRNTLTRRWQHREKTRTRRPPYPGGESTRRNDVAPGRLDERTLLAAGGSQ